MRFLIDTNLTVRWVAYLIAGGMMPPIGRKLGDKEAVDTEICAYAREHGFVVLTNDLDFPQILASTNADGPSVILLRGHPLTPDVRGEALLKIVGQCEEDVSNGAILSVDLSGRPRARVLPLR